MIESRQLVLDFKHSMALTREDFLVTDINREAVDWLDRWPRWPAPALVLHGPTGCGKTHLTQLFLSQTQGRSLSVSDILSSDPSDLLERFPSYVIDNVEYVFGNRGAEQALLHIYNLVAESGRRMLLTAAYPPARFEIQLPDLRSRLRAAPVVGIGAPDDNLIRAVVVKLFVDRQLMVDDSVINYLFARMERSFDAARRLVERIDEESLRNKQKISIPLVRRVLQQDTSTENP